LERRIRAWRAVNGPDREVIFRQEHPPGRMCSTTVKYGTWVLLMTFASVRDLTFGSQEYGGDISWKLVAGYARTNV
jgi:hypothetical protein